MAPGYNLQAEGNEFFTCNFLMIYINSSETSINLSNLS